MQDAANGLYGRVGHALNLSLHDDHVCVSTQKKILFVAQQRWRQRARRYQHLQVATKWLASPLPVLLISIPLVTCANLFNTLLLSLLSPRQLPSKSCLSFCILLENLSLSTYISHLRQDYLSITAYLASIIIGCLKKSLDQAKHLSKQQKWEKSSKFVALNWTKFFTHFCRHTSHLSKNGEKFVKVC